MSDPEPDLAHLDEMIEAIGKIESYTGGATRDVFLADAQMMDAVSLNLLVIGESAGRLSDRTRDRAADIPWPALRTLRHRIAHGYRSIDHTIVWAIVEDRMGPLRAQLTSLLEQLEADL